MIKVKKENLNCNRDRLLYNIMEYLEILVNTSDNKDVKKVKGKIIKEVQENVLNSGVTSNTNELDIMSRQDLFKHAKKHNIKVKATLKTDELRKIIKGVE